jgi:hypothetical protein
MQWNFMQGKWVFRIAYSAALTVNVSSQVEACPSFPPPKKKQMSKTLTTSGKRNCNTDFLQLLSRPEGDAPIRMYMVISLAVKMSCDNLSWTNYRG